MLIARDIEALVHQQTGVEIRNLSVLDVGCGQQLTFAQYFAHLQNDVVGIDYNVIPVDFATYLSLLRTNGPLRVVKTLGRKVMGYDSRFSRNLGLNFPNQKPRQIKALQMDAERMSFQDAAFDFIYSHSVFEHLEHPELVVQEVKRVLKPGGVAHLGVHLYTCDGGAHDPRVFSGKRDDVPLWAHLRPQYVSLVRPNSYLNRIRLQQWRDIFSEQMPGVHIHLRQGGREQMLKSARDLRSELASYSEDELLTDEVVAVWQKPHPI